jgi:hypothetical protein
MIPLTLLATLVLFLVLSPSSTVANDLFSYNAVDANGETIPLSKYSSAKAILVGNRDQQPLCLFLILFL